MRVESDFRRDTRKVGRKERENYSSLVWNMLRMDPKPKVAILDIVGPMLDNPLGYEHESHLKTSVDHYKKRDDRAKLLRVLRFYCAYLMQQARKEPDFQKQLFSLFKAVDFARMIVQYSAYSVSSDAEAIVFGIFHDLGSQRPALFRKYLELEQTIYAMMKRLQIAPNDDRLRLELAQQMVHQTSYFDALVQYMQLLTRYPKMTRETDTKRGRVYIKIAEIFHELAVYAAGEPEEIKDARKLKSFIERYNRDYAERKKHIPIIQSASASQLKKAAIAMKEIAVQWILRAMAVKTLGATNLIRQVIELNEIYVSDRMFKESYKLLTLGYDYWTRVPETESSLQDRIEYLNQMVNVTLHLKKREKSDWANMELREYKSRLNEILARKKAAEDRKEALIMGEEPPESPFFPS